MSLVGHYKHYEVHEVEDRAHRPRRSYGTLVMMRAREYRRAGWTYEEIRSFLDAEFGARPCDETIAAWADPEFAERMTERLKLRSRRRRSESWRFQLGGRCPSPEYQAAFVRRLRAEGEPVSGIVRVCRVVFGGRWTRGRVLRLLEDES